MSLPDVPVYYPSAEMEKKVQGVNATQGFILSLSIHIFLCTLFSAHIPERLQVKEVALLSKFKRSMYFQYTVLCCVHMAVQKVKVEG